MSLTDIDSVFIPPLRVNSLNSDKVQYNGKLGQSLVN